MFVRSQKACSRGGAGEAGRAATLGFEISAARGTANGDSSAESLCPTAGCSIKRQIPQTTIAIVKELQNDRIAIPRRMLIL